jgi:hypothetical protein
MATSTRIGGGQPVKHWGQGLAHRCGWDGGPLRRVVDRTESVAMAALVVAFVVAGPLLAVFVGRAADAAALRVQRAQQASETQVRAVLLQSAAQAVDGYLDAAFPRARWTAPDGRSRTGTVGTGLDARAGQPVWIWVNRAGAQEPGPLSGADVRDQVMFSILVAVTALSVLLGAGAVAVRVLADRRRMTGWQRDWEASGPLWSRQG